MATASNIENPASKRLPPSLIELFDLAIFHLCLQTGLRATDKVRGDPVIEGVCAMFGDLLKCAKQETQDIFVQVSSKRFGNWLPGTQPTKQLSQFVSSRLQLNKTTGNIREIGGPLVPPSLVEHVQEFDEERDCVKTVARKALCWRCKRACRNCEKFQSKDFFRSE